MDNQYFKISVEEMNQLLNGVEKFYADRNHPKHTAIWLSDLVIKRLRTDKDLFLVAEGLRGNGKSNLLLLLALLQCRNSGIYKNNKTGKIVKVLPQVKPVNKEYTQIEVGFNFLANISFIDSTEILLKKFNSIDRYHPFILDEGSANLHKYMWNTERAFKLVNASNTQRYQNKSYAIAIPNFLELNSVFRNDRVAIRLFVFNRQKNSADCVVSLKDTNRHIPDPWHISESSESYEYYLKRIPIAFRTAKNQLYAERKLKNYAGHFEFPSIKDICPSIWEKYMQLKIYYAQQEIKNDVIDKTSLQLDKWKYAVKNLIEYIKFNFKKDLSSKEISQMTLISSGSLGKLKMQKFNINSLSDPDLQSSPSNTPSAPVDSSPST